MSFLATVRTITCVCVFLGLFFAAPLCSAKAWDAKKFAEQCVETRDDFKKTAYIRGPLVRCSDDSGLEINRFSLSNSVYADGKSDYWLMFKSARGSRIGWAFWDAATDENGVDFVLEGQNRKVGAEGLAEETQFCELKREYLDAAASSGVKIKFYGKNGAQKIIFLSPAHLNGFLARCDAK